MAINGGNSDGEFFLDYLRGHMEHRGWTAAELARRIRMTQAQVSRVLSGEQRAGDDFLHGVAEAFEVDQVSVYRAAGKITDLPAKTVREDETTKQIRRLMDQLPPEGQQRLLRLIEAYVRDHKP